MAEILLLGSGGWIPTATRETCCALVREDDYALVLDAGTGIQRLVEDPSLLDGTASVDLLLTHFHLDHIAGLAYLPALELRRPPAVWGPGLRLYGEETDRLLRRFLDPPLQSGLERFVDKITEVPDGPFELGPFRAEARRQDAHTVPTLAYSLGGLLTLCTDTSFDRGNAAFARDTPILLHEAWYTEAAPVNAEIHSSGREAGRVARKAGTGRLVLIHFNPLLHDEQALVNEARSEFGDTLAGEDGLRLVPS